MDNPAAHKVDGVRQRIGAAGATLLYLPPYSPDFNPIEKARSKIEQRLRSVKSRTGEVLEQTVAEALTAITPQNASAWFSHCGCGLQSL
jgi:transposase